MGVVIHEGTSSIAHTKVRARRAWEYRWFAFKELSEYCVLLMWGLMLVSPIYHCNNVYASTIFDADLTVDMGMYL